MGHSGSAVVLGIFCWTLVLFSNTDTAQASTAGAALVAGDSAFAKGEFNSAVSLYERAVQQDPTNLLPLTKRAAAYEKLGQHSAALRDLTAALQIDSNATRPLLQRAQVQKGLCSFASAEADLRALLDLRSTHKAGLQERQAVSDARQKLDQYTAASPAQRRTAFTSLLTLAPACTPARLLEAGLLMAEQDHAGAIALTGVLLKSQPGHVEALVLRGKAFALMGDLDSAKRHYGEALRHDPDDGPAQAAFQTAKRLARLMSQADAAASKGRWQDAEAAAAEAVSIDANLRVVNTALWLSLCKARLNLRRTGSDSAKQACTVAAEHVPDDPEPSILRVKALLLEEDVEGAVRAAAELRQRHPNSRSVLQVQQEVDKARRMAERKDYYAILGVDHSAQPRDIKSAYRKRAQIYHPDKVADAGLSKEEAQQRFTDIAEAYEVLTDEEKRAAYDRGDDVELGPGQAGFHGGGFPGGGFPGGGFGGQQFSFRFG
ncbi:hypothetical protein WJX73_001573 [Symbiochloris irregularis]|uniref:J domain-containing protein n=1 Tax=Symbiochloris irregularis TaxID=706552 RepID=A0AAW1NU09_9CHLO